MEAKGVASVVGYGPKEVPICVRGWTSQQPGSRVWKKYIRAASVAGKQAAREHDTSPMVGLGVRE